MAPSLRSRTGNTSPQHEEKSKTTKPAKRGRKVPTNEQETKPKEPLTPYDKALEIVKTRQFFIGVCIVLVLLALYSVKFLSTDLYNTSTSTTNNRPPPQMVAPKRPVIKKPVAADPTPGSGLGDLDDQDNILGQANNMDELKDKLEGVDVEQLLEMLHAANGYDVNDDLLHPPNQQGQDQDN